MVILVFLSLKKWHIDFFINLPILFIQSIELLKQIKKSLSCHMFVFHNQEAALVKEVSDLYIRTLHQIEEQLERDHSTKARLEADWSDKQDAWKILIENARLKTTSNTVMFKPAATRYTEKYIFYNNNVKIFCTLLVVIIHPLFERDFLFAAPFDAEVLHKIFPLDLHTSC